MPTPTLAESVHELRHRVQPKTNWTEAETVLAYVLAVYLPVSTLGGTKRRADGSERQHPAVRALAGITHRTADAVVLKVMNLRHALSDGDRGFAHVSRMDRQVVERFAGHLDELAAAMDGLAADWPDLESLLAEVVESPDLPGLGEEPRSTSWLHDVLGEAPPETERLATTKTRLGHGLFRTRVVGGYGRRCVACGVRAREPRHDGIFLRAGHVKPWKDASAHERLDPANGLALCVTHDRSFEAGLMTVDESLRIVVSARATPSFDPVEFGSSALDRWNGEPLKLPRGRGALRPGLTYLEWHRETIFERF